MNWKSWPYWVRGGMIGLIIGVISIVTIVNGNEFVLKIILLLSYPLNVFTCGKECADAETLVTIFTGPIMAGVLGVIIGYLYGKWNNRT